MHLYPNVVIKKQNFAGVKKLAVPSQSLTLKEILKRFVRRESLPVEHEGVYNDRLGDLEKLAKMDVVDQLERVDEIKNAIDKGSKRVKKAHDERVKAEIKRQAEKEQSARAMAEEAKPDNSPSV